MPTAAANPLLVVEQALLNLVLAWPGLTQIVAPRSRPLLLPGNLIRFDGTARWPEGVKPFRQTADGIEFKLDVASGRPDPKGARTLCIQPSVDAVDFTWTLTSPTKQLTDVTQAVAELRACMNAAGVQLGIPATVARWEWAMRPARATGKNPDLFRAIAITQTVYVKS